MRAESCPICGAAIAGEDPESAALAYARHRCPDRTLAAIDGAHRREPDDEEARAVPSGRRLAEGMQMLGWAYRDDPRVW